MKPISDHSVNILTGDSPDRSKQVTGPEVKALLFLLEAKSILRHQQMRLFAYKELGSNLWRKEYVKLPSC